MTSVTPPTGGLPPDFGFREGTTSTHTSRTAMFAELSALFAYLPLAADRESYATAVVEDNVLSKRTASNRRLTLRHLSELYGLDASLPIFRAMRQLWELDPAARPMLAILCANARDPLLRATSPLILDAPLGAEVAKDALIDAMNETWPGRFSPASLDSVALNILSSWAQSGHLAGRYRKIRRNPAATPASTVYALFLGYGQGLRGATLLDSYWVKILDCSASSLD